MCVCVSVRELREYMIRIAQVEFEAVSQIPERTQKLFFRVSLFRVSFRVLVFVVSSFVSSLFWD